METGGGDGSETGLVRKMGEQKSMTSICASRTPDLRDKEGSNNNNNNNTLRCQESVPSLSVNTILL